MSISTQSKNYQIFNDDSINLSSLSNESVDSLITDPPYGISYQNHDWDKALPNKKIWLESYRLLKPGSFGLVFSSVRLMHRLMVDLEDSGFIIKDVLFWVYLNGMPKTRDVALDIDDELGVESKSVGEYKYVQGYKKGGAETYLSKSKKFIKIPQSFIAKDYEGSGLNLKPAYEPIILIQKPIHKTLTVAQNVIKYGTGVLNIQQTRIPFAKDEKKVGHNPNPLGRIPSNIIRTENHNDGYDKFFTVPKVRQNKDAYNFHPTIKPTELMAHLVKLSTFKGQTVLDPFMGSGSTGVACKLEGRKFIGFEIDKTYYNIAKQRMLQEEVSLFQ
jgi:site-specific DNA-methyltransferase (adenine-specific)